MIDELEFRQRHELNREDGNSGCALQRPVRAEEDRHKVAFRELLAVIGRINNYRKRIKQLHEARTVISQAKKTNVSRRCDIGLQ